MKIDYSKLRQLCESYGISMKDAASRCDITYAQFRSLAVYNHNPTTDVIAKICYGFEIRPSVFVKFDFEYPRIAKLYGSGKCKKPCRVTYQPLKELFIDNLLKGKHPNDEDELYVLLGNYSPIDKDTQQKVIHCALNARNIDYNSENLKKRDGLSTMLRTSIKNDKPVNMRLIYDICKVLECNIDNILYYKCID